MKSEQIGHLIGYAVLIAFGTIAISAIFHIGTFPAFCATLFIKSLFS